MNALSKVVPVALIAFACFREVYAQGRAAFQLTATVENDFLAPYNRDENYTGAAKVEVSTPEWYPAKFPFIKFDGSTNIQRLAIGATAYTPQDLESEAIVVGDRPYASFAFLDFGNDSYDLEHSRLFQSDVFIGFMGTRGPGNAQAYIHRKHWFGTDRPIPKGWDNQIGYSRSFAINYNTRFQQSVFHTASRGDGFVMLEAAAVAEADIGTYMMNLQGGIRLNLFNIHPSPLLNVATVMPTIAPLGGTKFRFNMFLEPQIRLAGYNATLEGLLFNDHSTYTISHSQVKRILFEFASGFNLLVADQYLLRFAITGRSREFGEGKPFHWWGSLTFAYSPRRWYSEEN